MVRADGLTDKQARFIAEYLIDLNATQAAIRAGYSADSAGTIGGENMQKPEILSAIAEAKAKQLETAHVSAARVIEEYRRIAFLDVRTFYDAEGNLLPVQQWTAEQGSAVASFETLIKNAKAGDGVTDTVHKIRLVDKTRALESLAKHLGLLVERVHVDGAADLIAVLMAGREHARNVRENGTAPQA